VGTKNTVYLFCPIKQTLTESMKRDDDT